DEHLVALSPSGAREALRVEAADRLEVLRVGVALRLRDVGRDDEVRRLLGERLLPGRALDDLPDVAPEVARVLVPRVEPERDVERGERLLEVARAEERVRLGGVREPEVGRRLERLLGRLERRPARAEEGEQPRLERQRLREA